MCVWMGPNGPIIVTTFKDGQVYYHQPGEIERDHPNRLASARSARLLRLIIQIEYIVVVSSLPQSQNKKQKLISSYFISYPPWRSNCNILIFFSFFSKKSSRWTWSQASHYFFLGSLPSNARSELCNLVHGGFVIRRAFLTFGQNSQAFAFCCV